MIWTTPVCMVYSYRDNINLSVYGQLSRVLIFVRSQRKFIFVVFKFRDCSLQGANNKLMMQDLTWHDHYISLSQSHRCKEIWINNTELLELKTPSAGRQQQSFAIGITENRPCHTPVLAMPHLNSFHVRTLVLALCNFRQWKFL